jgi:hypothetical protein
MEMTFEEEQRGRELAEKMPGLMFQVWSKVPSPLSAALYTGLAGAGLAMLLKKSPWKWGLVAGGGGFLASAAVKGSFAAGMMSGGMMMAKECVQNPREVAAMYHDVFTSASSVPSVATGWEPWERPWEQRSWQRPWQHPWEQERRW